MSRTRMLVLAAALAVTGVTAVPAAAAAAPPEAPLLAVGGEAVPGSYIVVFKDGSKADAAALAERHGAAVRRSFAAGLRGFSIQGSERAARRIAAEPSVAYVQPNLIHRISATQSPATWGIDRIDQRNLPLSNSYAYNTTASSVRAYIIDTGIRFSHGEFGGRAVSGFDAVDGGSADDANGHGTHVAGTVGGATYVVAKEVTLVGVRVLDAEGSGTTEQVVAGIDWVTADHDPGEPAVANMSLGGSADTVLDNAVKASIADGVTYAIAAGNGILGIFAANACNYSPARVPEAITVSATQGNDAKPSWANRGTCVDIFAPGVDITSSWFGGDTATNTISGTSMATPHVTGAAALYLQSNPTATPAQVQQALIANATTGVVGSPGSGSPNRLLYTANF
ncbi:S8 family serine peptidase [Catellatospora sp. KI3]|uniref:S8 family peptidase n=1 Tax=Catellatospora sp. KI3 TaxID=3041620 RepID=UPI002482F589|nr:S8 family peptidase [Catellatospora sp. KI3]MDI1459454.1 S8 family serine peptidase [Catellatospora sp. KI3]